MINTVGSTQMLWSQLNNNSQMLVWQKNLEKAFALVFLRPFNQPNLGCCLILTDSCTQKVNSRRR